MSREWCRDINERSVHFLPRTVSSKIPAIDLSMTNHVSTIAIRISRPDKKRPVLILTRDSASEFLGEVTVAPVTTTIRDIPSEVLLTKADGMPRDCAVNLDHLQTVSKGK
ncbi:MAG TPA: type II toxin-antitoxin system PemK/MazF family toxin [Candidatus Binatia bacterium]|nr:type II toxin-antitoxin system PemK/MazF family toxin [Candidatus Binatia bacterium]